MQQYRGQASHQKPALKTNNNSQIEDENHLHLLPSSCTPSSPGLIPLRALTTETTGELKVLGLDSDSLSVDGSEVGVLEEGD